MHFAAVGGIQRDPAKLPSGLVLNPNPGPPAPCLALWGEILTGEVESGEPVGKACPTRACGRQVESTQAGAPHQSYRVPRSSPKSASETRKKY